MTLVNDYPLETTKILKKTIQSMSRFLMFFVFAIIFLYAETGFFDSFVWIFILYFVLIVLVYVLLKYIYEIYYFKNYYYDVADNLVIKKGVFSRNEINLPFSRLQDVYVDQDVLDRIFGLYDVHVSSATTISGNLSHIDGLNQKNAEAIKNLLLSKIKKEK